MAQPHPVSPRSFYKNKRVLMTLGPTREYLDPVRFLSNASSGTMGLALAKVFQSLGAKVFLVRGPGVRGHEKFPSVGVVSARDMLTAVQKKFAWCDIFVSVAAVADYRPAQTLKTKSAKRAGGLTLQLKPNPDILAAVSKKKQARICVGFALESPGPAALGKARKKMRRKHCDFLVLNTTGSMESQNIDATLLTPNGSARRLGKVSKELCAKTLCQTISQSTFKKKS